MNKACSCKEDEDMEPTIEQCRAVWTAVILRSVMDIAISNRAYDIQNEYQRQNALRNGETARWWINSKDTSFFGAFENICDGFGFDKDAIRGSASRHVS